MEIQSLRNCPRTQQLLFPRQAVSLVLLAGGAVATSQPMSALTVCLLNLDNRLGLCTFPWDKQK